MSQRTLSDQAVKARQRSGYLSKEQTGIEIATAELQAAPDYQTAGFGRFTVSPGPMWSGKIRAGFQPG